MPENEKSIYIIGAGISGLIAAIVLERHGFSPKIIEAYGSVGGRVKTAVKDNYLLDHGFQVLLEAYPKAKEYLDYEALELQKFVPGASIFYKGKKVTLGDASRNLSLAWPTLTAGVGSFTDKWKVLKLALRLRNKSVEAIFEEEERTTLAYLQKEGFSQEMIDLFFKPFFTGIFLETKLETSSRMFEFVFKMFGEGAAVIPKKGIGAIPEQLLGRLSNTKMRYRAKVKAIENKKIVLTTGEELDFEAVIIATDANGLLKDHKIPKVNWKNCDNFYFRTDNPVLEKPIIGLVADEQALINNLYYPSVFSGQKNGNIKNSMLSVTVVKDHNLSPEELESRVIKDLKEYCGISVSSSIAHFPIRKALPDLKDIKYSVTPQQTYLMDGIFQAGDQILNGSLNAAMIAGERAAQGVVDYLKKS
ncbi:NAD(P)/FAD-dependent oxidoreductase [Flavobacteriaceae bacterium M23B6Z8]